MGQKLSIARHAIVGSALGLAALAVGCGLFYFVAYQFEQQRIADADPALRPLLPLKARMLCSPGPFARYCDHFVEFDDASELTNDNVGVLTSLNKLPTGNNLHVWIVTQRVSDESLPTLKQIHTIDILDATESAISDAGIEELATALTDTKVNRRKSQ